MTTNIFSILNTAKVGLLAQQFAIEVTGQNVANVQTEGYTRQEVTFETTPSRQSGLAQLGTGVRIAGIRRAHDQFLFTQIADEEQSRGRLGIRKDMFDQIEALFNEADGRNLNASLSDLFAGLQDLSTNPTGLPERSTLLARGEALTMTFNQIGQSLFAARENLDRQVTAEVSEINDMTKRIAQLNKEIHGGEPGKSLANDLRDSRDKLVRELSQKLDVTVVDELNGQLSLTMNNGQALILGQTAFTLSTQLNGNNKGFKDVFLDNGAGPVNITANIQDGKLKGLLEMRDTELEGIKDRLDRLAAGLVREFNGQHQQGISLDGTTGLNFFENLTPTVLTNTQNTGGATVTAVNGSPVTSSVDDFEMVFTSSNAFTLNNLTTGQTAGSFSFLSGVPFNIAGGLAVTVNGAAAKGDRFRISVSDDASVKMALSKDVQNKPARIAAGGAGPNDGNNAQALASLQNSQIFDSTSLVGTGQGTFTFDEFYNALIGEIGVNSATANNGMEQQDGILLQLKNRREEISGVSIDEEMLNMIKFQQAFGAAARLVSVVNDMFDVLQNRI